MTLDTPTRSDRSHTPVSPPARWSRVRQTGWRVILLLFALAVISDVPKTLVYETCEFINRHEEIIPRRILTKAPSAELRPDQKDEDSLPPYDILDPIIKGYIEEDKGLDALVSEGFDRETVAYVIRLIDRNEFKRWQAAPGLRITAKAFGIGRRYPIAAHYPKP